MANIKTEPLTLKVHDEDFGGCGAMGIDSKGEDARVCNMYEVGSNIIVCPGLGGVCAYFQIDSSFMVQIDSRLVPAYGCGK
ncbi:MAG: hypothetical protein NUV37_00915 [Nanoarchaeota archaeon]|nr:hypothetical protein [Nanoarchaeota archaeon]